jgi:methyl halide transferase
MANVSVAEARAKLRSHFSSSTFQGDSEAYGKGWDDLWQKGDFLPWDRFAPSPALVDTLVNHHGVIGNHEVNGRRKKALVPGCGRGVDVLLLESYGYDTVGLEYSAKAVEECERFAKERGGEYEVKVKGGSRKFVQGDFYKDDWLEKVDMKQGETFDLIYDYTVSRCVILVCCNRG